MSRAIRTETAETEREAWQTPPPSSDAPAGAGWDAARVERVALRVGLYWTLANGLFWALSRPAPDARMQGVLVAAVALAGLAGSVRPRA